MAESSGQKSKRSVRDPETFRERAIKASENDAKPQRSHKVRGFFGRILGFIFKPIGRLLRFVFYRKPFLYLRRPLRFLAKILFIDYIRNSWKELRQVTWPNWQQSRSLTFAVIIFAAVFGALIAGLDWGLDKIFKQILLK